MRTPAVALLGLLGLLGQAAPVHADDPAAVPTAPVAPVAPAGPRHGSNAAWILAGTSLAFIVTGSVLAYASSSSEQDVRDLYTTLENTPATYTVDTAQKYHQLLDEGRRYEHYAWASFGLAGACALGAAFTFAYGPHRIEVAPLVAPGSAGAAAQLHF